eukprot:115517_1
MFIDVSSYYGRTEYSFWYYALKAINIPWYYALKAILMYDALKGIFIDPQTSLWTTSQMHLFLTSQILCICKLLIYFSSVSMQIPFHDKHIWICASQHYINHIHFSN